MGGLAMTMGNECETTTKGEVAVASLVSLCQKAVFWTAAKATLIINSLHSAGISGKWEARYRTIAGKFTSVVRRSIHATVILLYCAVKLKTWLTELVSGRTTETSHLNSQYLTRHQLLLSTFSCISVAYVE